MVDEETRAVDTLGEEAGQETQRAGRGGTRVVKVGEQPGTPADDHEETPNRPRCGRHHGGETHPGEERGGSVLAA